jgi:hypothetical protein
MIQLHNGDLLAVLRSGAAHRGIKGRIDLVRSTDGGKTWSAPQVLVDGPWDDRNPAMGQLADGTITMTYAVLMSYDEKGNITQPSESFDALYTIRSHDSGKTWDKPVKSSLDGMGASPYGKIVQLPDGTALVNVVQDMGGQKTWVYRSRDGGRTWSDPTLLGIDYDEAALVVLPSGTVVAGLRAEPYAGDNLSISISTDKGYSWSKPKAVTAAKEIPADFTVLQNGWLLLTYGQRNRPYGAEAVISRDGGRSWDNQRIMLVGNAHNPDCGYPKSVQRPDGRIVTMYYGLDGDIDYTGVKSNAPAEAYARVIVWSLPK